MIEEVAIRGFKRFRDERLSLRKLTVLAGLNGSGKTSVVHALLLAREAWRRNDGVVELNGPFDIALGGFDDVLNRDSSVEFAISLFNGGELKCGFTFTAGKTELYANVTSVVGAQGTGFMSMARSFQYLSAERLGPRITLGSSALPDDLLEVGCKGQFSAQVINNLSKEVVHERRRSLSLEPESLSLLKPQTELWLSRVTRPVQIDTESYPGTGVTALKFRTGEDWVRPTNMGFGVTYALPVILAGLTAMEGGLLLVENPEAHLHPAGQSQMGVFLASIAASGVQIIVETHSDHILNGIRRAIAEQGILSPNDAVVNFFSSEGSEVAALTFTERGGVSAWPSGFFDQYQLDVSALTRVRRPR